jgi:hypothetical protein
MIHPQPSKVVEAHDPADGHVIDVTTRVLIATLINRVVREG